MTERKTIDSAPKDGSRFIAIQMTQGDYFGYCAILSRVDYHEFNDGGGVWIGVGGMMPTHWRPLPSPPKET